MIDQIEKLSFASTATNSDEFNTQRANTLQYLRALDEIRVLICDSQNFGHQTSSVNILRNLIRLEIRCPFTILLYCETSDEERYEALVGKIKLLIPQFKELGVQFTLEDAKVTVSRLDKVELKRRSFGITGGWDSDKYLPLNLLQVANFVQLQPYAWHKGKNLIIQDNNVTDLDLIESLKLNRRAFYLVDPETSQSDWVAIDNSIFFEKADIVKKIICKVENEKCDLCPVYGISTDNEDPQFPLYNIVAGILEAQTTLQLERGAVVLVMAKVEVASWELFESFVRNPEDFASATVDKSRPSADLKEWHKQAQVNDRVTTIWKKKEVTKEKVEEAINALTKKQVLVVNLGDIPAPLFQHLYRIATLPPVMEGQNTTELMINLGRAYFKINLRRTREWVSFNYPTLPITANADCSSAKCSDLITRSNVFPGGSPSEWKNGEGEIHTYPPTYNVQMIAAYLGICQELYQYFAALRTFYHQEKNDKLLLALNYFVNVVKPATVETEIVEAMLATSPLEQLYEELKSNIRDGELDFLQAVTTGLLNEFFKQVVDDGLFKITGADLEPPEFTPETSEVTLTGSTSAFGAGNTSLEFKFTEQNDAIVANLEASFTEATSDFPGAQWLAVSEPGLKLTLDTGGAVPVTGAFTGKVTAGFTMQAAVTLPSEPGNLLLQGVFVDEKPSITNIFQMVGGINLQAILPQQLQLLTDIEVQQFELRYNYSDNTMEYIGVNLGTPSDNTWDLVPAVEVTSLQLQATVNKPGDLRQRTTSYRIGGSFDIGDGKCYIDALVPELQVSGGLADDSSLTVASIVEACLGPQFVQVLPDFIENTQIDKLSFWVDKVLGAYAFTMGVRTEWPIDILGTTLFTITGLGFAINATSRDIDPAKPDKVGSNGNDNKTGTEITGNFNGTTVILPDSANIGLSVSASYGGSEAGWTFEGRQTSGQVPLGDLIKEYLGWETEQEYGIDGLGLTIETKTNSWEFTGKTAEPWEIPITGIAITGNMKIGYNGGSKTLGPALVRTGKAAVPVLMPDGRTVMVLAADGDDKKPGPYGHLEAEIQWRGIDLTVFYDYHPEYKSFGIAWGILTGKIEEKQIDGKTHQVATLKFTESTTLGSMVETMVSWATGSQFGLGAPWNILDSIPLNNLSLTYDFTASKVSFDVGIGPINLGFARIDGISLSYNSGSEKTEDNGVIVTLNGSFPWNTGEDAVGTTSSLGPWDATKPEKTPAPSGQGNKYFDLRLLAMGQHVTTDCFKTADTVQKAIACMADMPDPEPGQIPSIQPDPQSSWLVGADFGILKLEKKKNADHSKALVPLGKDNDAKPPGYFLTLQVVFNDPRLYALRVALAGDAAKIFKGLDFQIMYRQVSDTVGVYQSEITLPDRMRRFSVGAFTITLPVFGIAVYTNGDFQVDIGFPWNEDFTRSFTVEAIIYVIVPIPVLGSAGLYFGKLSSATTTKVPAATNGTFNPVIVFGFGARLGFGYSADFGILKAGFSLTAVGIIEGVIAKWNPYPGADSGDEGDSQLQGAYYFGLSGTVGVMGKLYGTVDFAIIKADVNVQISLLVQITLAPYEPIPITVQAAVDVSVGAEINLGLFKIKIHFTFSVKIKETLTIPNSGTPPWQVTGAAAKGVLRAPAARRLRAMRQIMGLAALRATEPDWSNLQKPAQPSDLSGWLAPALTMAGDAASSLAEQQACYVAMPFIESVPPANQDSHTSALKAMGAQPDTSFETLCKQVFRWAIAAIQHQPLTAEQVDQLVVTDDQLNLLFDHLSDSETNPTPIPPDAIESFLSDQFVFTVHLPPSDVEDEADATYFPMALPLELDIPDYGGWKGYQYTFADFNTIARNFLSELREYFRDLAVQVESEDKSKQPPPLLAFADGEGPSVASFVFDDYFLLIARQMVQAARDALRDFKYPIQSGQTANQIVQWINDTGDTEQLPAEHVYTLYDLFAANPTHPLTVGKSLTIGGGTYQVRSSDTFESIALEVYGRAGTDLALATVNASKTDILQPGQTITYKDELYTIQPGDSLNGIAQDHFESPLADFLTGSGVLSQKGLLAPKAKLDLQLYATYQAKSADTFRAIAALSVYGQAFDATKLATLNAGRSILRANAEIIITDVLFNLDSTFVNELDTGQITTGLQQEFSDHNVPLSQDARVIVLEKSNRWRIIDHPIEDHPIEYLIEVKEDDDKEDPVLEVHREYVVQPGDSLDAAAGHLDMTLSDLLSKTNALHNSELLMPVAVLDIPPFGYTTQSGDNLQSVMARFNFSLENLAYQEANGAIGDLFATAATDSEPTPYLDVPHLVQFQVGELIAEAQRSLALQHLSGMTSRYYLHGMRLPTVGITPKCRGMWVEEDNGKLTPLPDKAGLYALTGQQFPLPDITEDEGSFTIIFNRPESLKWLVFAGDNPNQLTVEIKPDSTDNTRIEKVKAHATANRLGTGLTRLGAEPMYTSKPATYPFTSVTIWQSAGDVSLPYGDKPDGVPALCLWKLSNAMANLPDPAVRAVNPRFKIQIGRYDEASGAMVASDVTYYGWATTIEFKIKKIPPILTSPTTETTYQVVGAGDVDIVLLERLLAQVGGDDSAFASLALGYSPDQTGDAPKGVQTDDAGKVTMGIAQVNLSTVTHPPTTMEAAMVAEGDSLGLLNKPSEFLRLLWEASITRSGGFYLYYYNPDAGSGLPDQIFNDKDEAAVTLIVLYSKPLSGAEQNRLANYMNALATGESIDTSNAVVFAQADPPDEPPTRIEPGENDSLASIAYGYYADVGDLARANRDLARANRDLALTFGKKMLISEGVYQVPPDGVEPGGDLSKIAAHFGTTVQAIKDANPRRTDWPDLLPLYTAIRLPPIEVTVGTSPGGDTLGSIAAYYGEDLTALAAHNRNTPGLFAPDQQMTIPGGPTVRSATVPPGVVAVEAQRPVPPEVPDPDDSNFAKCFLLNTYSMLNYRVVENDDFRGSNMGLPAGPTTEPDQSQNYDKIRISKLLTADDTWDYQQAMPYPKFAKLDLQPEDGLPDPTQSPYLAVGFLLQVDFEWQDLYGNTLITVLSDPNKDDHEPLNQPPILTGYTDALIGLGQWPSVSSGWQVLPGQAGNAQQQLNLSFDASRYKPDTQDLGVPSLPGDNTPPWRKNAKHDLLVYTQLWYQLTDPNGVAFTIQTSLLKGDDSQGGTIELSPTEVSDLLQWLGSIYKFIDDRAKGNTTVPEPDANHSINNDIDSSALNDNQIFRLSLSFIIERTGGSVLGDFETTPGIKRTSTPVAPLMTNRFLFSLGLEFVNELDAGQVSDRLRQEFQSHNILLSQEAEVIIQEKSTKWQIVDGSRKYQIANEDQALKVYDPVDLVQFAQNFEEALSQAGLYKLKVAAGVDRTRLSPTQSGAAIWAVRLRLANSEGISYSITNQGSPAIYAPRPISNQLESRNQVPIRDYQKGSGLSEDPTRFLDFIGIDMDLWGGQFFTAIDGVLSPEFTAAIQIVDQYKDTNYLQQILGQKKALAKIIKLWMVHVFKAEKGTDLTSAQEAFYQQLLERLSNAYTTRAAIQFKADVNADIDDPIFGLGLELVTDLDAGQVSDQLRQEFQRHNILLSQDAKIMVLKKSESWWIVDGSKRYLTVNEGQALNVYTNLPRLFGNIVQNESRGLTGDGDGNTEPRGEISLTSPKLDLETSSEQPLVFLLTAPDMVEGGGGQVVSNIALDLSYDGSAIEHQIGSVPGIKDYEASSWLSFVIPETDGPLQAELGEFQVPLVLRAYPASPTMADQAGAATDPKAKELSKLTQWDYSFTYALPFHYPQDRVYCEVDFNIAQALTVQAGFEDAFNQLAQFITVFPDVNRDLDSILATIDATTSDQETIDNAAVALQSFIKMVSDVTDAAQGAGLVMAERPKPFTSTDVEPFNFYIQECSVDVGSPQAALLVTLVGKPPEGIGQPVILVDQDNYDYELYTGNDCEDKDCNQTDRFCFVYKKKGTDDEYLSAADGQATPDRRVVLPEMDILQRQDAWSTVSIKRNLVPDKPLAKHFVYTTPNMQFANPHQPTIDTSHEIDIATLGSPHDQPVKRALDQHLTALFDALLKDNTQESLTFQVECSYDYPVNPDLAPVSLPVLMQAPLSVDVTKTEDRSNKTLAEMISDWTQSIQRWFDKHKPKQESGVLWFDLITMSNLTQQPMPLLRLRKLKLEMSYIDDDQV
jgi:LysM repeat protein